MPVIKDEVLADLVKLNARVRQSPNGSYSVYVRLSPSFEDESIDSVVLCPNVEDLTLERVTISDEGLKKLKNLPLKRLILNGSPVTPAGVELLSTYAMANTLVSIGLKEVPIEDKHVALFKKFKQLRRLDLAESLITDESIPTLQQLPLAMLNVTNSKISGTGIAKLRKVMPATEIISEVKPIKN